MAIGKFKKSILYTLCALSVVLSWGMTECFAGPTFFDTTNPAGHWYVSWNTTGVDGNYGTSFKTADADFNPAVLASWRSDGFITNFANGASNGISPGIGNWTFFVFRQTFDLTGYDPNTAVLSFQWCADDIPQYGNWMAGNWIPKFKLNGVAFQDGGVPAWYDYSNYAVGQTAAVQSGFVSGWNTIDFYVLGNGATDGFGLRNVSFTATPSGVPEPATMLLLGFGIAGLAGARRFKK